MKGIGAWGKEHSTPVYDIGDQGICPSYCDEIPGIPPCQFAVIESFPFYRCGSFPSIVFCFSLIPKTADAGMLERPEGGGEGRRKRAT